MILAPEVHQAYRDIVETSVPSPEEHLFAIDVTDDELARLQSRKIGLRTILRDELGSDHNSDYLIVDISSISNHARVCMHEYLGLKSRLPIIEREHDMYGVAGFVVNGLEQNPSTGQLEVGYRLTSVVGLNNGDQSYEIDFLVNSHMAYVIDLHPSSELYGSDFASEARRRISHLLTPEVVDIVLNDETRVVPTIRRTTSFHTDGLTVVSEVINGPN